MHEAIFLWDGEREVERYFYFYFFFLFAYFSNLRKSDRRFLSGLKAKLIYAMRATREHKKVGVSTNSVRYGFYPTCFILCLSVFMMLGLIEAVSGRLIGPKTWDRIVGIFGAHLTSLVTVPGLFGQLVV